jgi:CheY-like chemotaxis protein
MPASTIKPPDTTRKRGKIMLVDDSPVIAESVAIMLEEYGYDVVALDRIFAFAETVRREQPDLVLIDVMMPAITGDKLVEIAQRHQTIRCPLVLFSNKKPEHLARLAEACGAAGYIQKTDDALALARAVAGYIKKP